MHEQYFNQILTVVLEVLDDPDSSIRELALSLIVEMLNHQVCDFSHLDCINVVEDFTLHILSAF